MTSKNSMTDTRDPLSFDTSAIGRIIEDSQIGSGDEMDIDRSAYATHELIDFGGSNGRAVNELMQQVEPRLYQKQLLSLAMECNIIAVVDTGAGKTLVAVLLLKHMHSLEDPNRMKRVSLFLVPTVTLVAQQAEYITRNSNLKTEKLWGGKVDIYDCVEYWNDAVKTYDVFVMTPEIAREALDHAYISIEQINLIIFDECHHARGNNACALLMEGHYFFVEESKRPRILGMTASPVIGKDDIEKSLQELEYNLRATAVMCNNPEEILKYVSKPVEIIEVYESNNFFTLPPLFEELFNSSPSLLKLIRRNCDSLYLLLDELGTWCCARALEQTVLSIKRLVRRLIEMKDLLDKMQDVEEPLDTAIIDPDGIFSHSSVDENDLIDLNEVEIINIIEEAEVRETEDLLNLKDSEILQNPSITKEVLESAILECDLLQLSKNWGSLEQHISQSVISSKVQTLVDVLRRESNQDSVRGIIFVKKRLHASVLHQLICNHPDLHNITSELLMGHGGLAANGTVTFDVKMSVAKQQMIVNRFREGGINLLVATQVAEEGLDIEACNFVVRFDMAESVVNYIQSRGRARHKDSKFIVLSNKITRAEETVLLGLRETESAMKRMLCKADQDSSSFDLKRFVTSLRDSVPQEIYCDPTTGARVTPHACISLLNQYCEILQADKVICKRAKYTIIKSVSGFHAHITMPAAVAQELRTHKGPSANSHKDAKKCCAFEFVQKLHKLGQFDPWLRPFSAELAAKIVKVKSVKSQNAGKAKADNKARHFNLGIPEAFAGDWAGDSVMAFLNVIEIVSCSHEELGLVRPEISANKATKVVRDDEEGSVSGNMTMKDALLGSKKVLLLEQLDPDYFPSCHRILRIGFVSTGSIPAATDYLHLILNSVPHKAKVRTLKEHIALSNKAITDARHFHHKVMEGTLRSVIDESSEWAVLFVPLNEVALESASFDALADMAPSSLISWDDIDYCQTVDESDLSAVLDPATPASDLSQVILYDEVQYKRKFHIRKVNYDANPLTQLSLPGKFKNVKELYTYRFKCKTEIDPSQPVIEAEMVRHPLSVTPGPTKTNEKMYVLPRFCTIYPIKSAFLVDALYIPMVFTQIWHRLLAVDLKMGRGLKDRTQMDEGYENGQLVTEKPLFNTTDALLQTALTTTACRLPFNYERLEFLGDAVLKIYQTLHVFVQHPAGTEGDMTSARNRIESNAALYDRIMSLNIDRFVNSWGFTRKDWVPPSFNNPTKQIAKRKVFADVAEAIIGACMIHGGFENGTRAVLVLLGDHYRSLPEYYNAHTLLVSKGTNPNRVAQYVSKNTINLVEKAIQYVFKDKNLLWSALTHSSMERSGPSYERLEFLGDAVLLYMITTFIFDNMPSNLHPGELSMIRTELICNQFLACVSVELGLLDHVQSMNSPLEARLRSFQEWLNEQTKGKSQTELIDQGLFWNEAMVAPKVAGDLYEAVLGAIFVDCGFDLELCRAFVNRTIIDRWFALVANHFSKKGLAFNHPVSELRALIRSKVKCSKVKYIQKRNKDRLFVTLVAFHTKVIAKGVGNNLKDARKAAAIASIEFLHKRKMTLKSHCDCVVSESMCEIEEVIIDEINETEPHFDLK